MVVTLTDAERETITELDDNTLIEMWQSYKDNQAHGRLGSDYIEYILQKRLEEKGATVLPSITHEVKMERRYDTDTNVLVQLREHIEPAILAWPTRRSTRRRCRRAGTCARSTPSNDTETRWRGSSTTPGCGRQPGLASSRRGNDLMFRHSIQRGRDDGGLLTGCGINIYADGSATARDLTEAIFNAELQSCRDCDRLFAKALGFSQEDFNTQMKETW